LILLSYALASAFGRAEFPKPKKFSFNFSKNFARALSKKGNGKFFDFGVFRRKTAEAEYLSFLLYYLAALVPNPPNADGNQGTPFSVWGISVLGVK